MSNQMNQQILTDRKRSLYDEVFERSYKISDLVPVEEVDEDADSWDDVSDDDLDAEIMEALRHAGPAEEHDGLIREYAIALWMSDLPRVSMDDMVFETMEEAVDDFYWPKKMDRYELEDLLWEKDETYGYPEAHGVAEAAYIDKFDPRSEKYDSL
jgi:hypothetical protein